MLDSSVRITGGVRRGQEGSGGVTLLVCKGLRAHHVLDNSHHNAGEGVSGKLRTAYLHRRTFWLALQTAHLIYSDDAAENLCQAQVCRNLAANCKASAGQPAHPARPQQCFYSTITVQ